MSFFEVSLFKYWSVEGKVCWHSYLWSSSILDWIKQRGGNKVTKTSHLSCLENKNLLGLKVKTQVKKIFTHVSLSHLWQNQDGHEPWDLQQCTKIFCGIGAHATSITMANCSDTDNTLFWYTATLLLVCLFKVCFSVSDAACTCTKAEITFPINCSIQLLQV